ncbi:MAG: hypothetical protein AB8G15_07600 [Saprospiraceae bacterium]
MENIVDAPIEEPKKKWNVFSTLSIIFGGLSIAAFLWMFAQVPTTIKASETLKPPLTPIIAEIYLTILSLGIISTVGSYLRKEPSRYRKQIGLGLNVFLFLFIIFLYYFIG